MFSRIFTRRRAADASSLNYGEAAAHSIGFEQKNFQVLFLDYREAIERLKKLYKQLLVKFNNLPDLALENVIEYSHLLVLQIAILGQIKFLQGLNDEHVNTPVAWELMGFPSPPSLMADLKKCSDQEELSKIAKAVLRSFSEWETIAEESLDCACVKNGKNHKVECDVKLRHILRLNGRKLHLKQFVAVSSKNTAHLQSHYSWGEIPSDAPELRLVAKLESVLELNESQELVLRRAHHECSRRIRLLPFAKLLEGALKNLENALPKEEVENVWLNGNPIRYPNY